MCRRDDKNNIMTRDNLVDTVRTKIRTQSRIASSPLMRLSVPPVHTPHPSLYLWLAQKAEAKVRKVKRAWTHYTGIKVTIVVDTDLKALLANSNTQSHRRNAIQ